MSLSGRLSDFVSAVGADIKALFSRAVPAGGSAGQVLRKASAADYALEWADAASGGSGGGALDLPTFGLESSFLNPQSQRVPLNPALWDGNHVIVIHNSAVPLNIGTVWTTRTNGTGSSNALTYATSGSFPNNRVRTRFSTGSKTTGSAGWQTSGRVAVISPSAYPSGGGFFLRTVIVPVTVDAGFRAFFGLSNVLNSQLTADKTSVLDAFAGLGCNAADANWKFQFSTFNGAQTIVDLGLPKTTALVPLELTLYNQPSTLDIQWRVKRLDTGAVLGEGTVTENTNGHAYYLHLQSNNAGGTSSNVIDLHTAYLWGR